MGIIRAKGLFYVGNLFKISSNLYNIWQFWSIFRIFWFSTSDFRKKMNKNSEKLEKIVKKIQQFWLKKGLLSVDKFTQKD